MLPSNLVQPLGVASRRCYPTQVVRPLPHRPSLLRWGAALLGLLALGCGPASPPPPATASHFDAIQRQEAIQDEVRVGVVEPDSPCEDVCEGTERGCRAAERICEIAESVTDADAEARCEMATDRCTRYRGAADRCPCS